MDHTKGLVQPCLVFYSTQVLSRALKVQKEFPCSTLRCPSTLCCHSVWRPLCLSSTLQRPRSPLEEATGDTPTAKRHHVGDATPLALHPPSDASDTLQRPCVQTAVRPQPSAASKAPVQQSQTRAKPLKQPLNQLQRDQKRQQQQQHKQKGQQQPANRADGVEPVEDLVECWSMGDLFPPELPVTEASIEPSGGPAAPRRGEEIDRTQVASQPHQRCVPHVHTNTHGSSEPRVLSPIKPARHDTRSSGQHNSVEPGELLPLEALDRARSDSHGPQHDSSKPVGSTTCREQLQHTALEPGEVLRTASVVPVRYETLEEEEARIADEAAAEYAARKAAQARAQLQARTATAAGADTSSSARGIPAPSSGRPQQHAAPAALTKVPLPPPSRRRAPIEFTPRPSTEAAAATSRPGSCDSFAELFPPTGSRTWVPPVAPAQKLIPHAPKLVFLSQSAQALESRSASPKLRSPSLRAPSLEQGEGIGGEPDGGGGWLPSQASRQPNSDRQSQMRVEEVTHRPNVSACKCACMNEQPKYSGLVGDVLVKLHCTKGHRVHRHWPSM